MNFEVEYNPKNNKENISKKYGKTVKRKKKKSSNKRKLPRLQECSFIPL